MATAETEHDARQEIAKDARPDSNPNTETVGHYVFLILRSLAMCRFAAALPFTRRAGFFLRVVFLRGFLPGGGARRTLRLRTGRFFRRLVGVFFARVFARGDNSA